MSDAHDPDALFDALVEEDVVDENGTVSLTDDFEHRWSVYFDTYASVTVEAFEESVADAFDVSLEAARASDVTRAELSYYLALTAHVDDEYTSGELGVMADMLATIGPSSPVPDDVRELDDETYLDFLAAHPDCVVSVWKRDCAPCEALIDDLPRIRAALPEDVAFSGVDGDDVVAFRREFAVDVAPAFLCFEGGECQETVDGSDIDTLVETLRSLYE
ncbi:thioredoxin domain-containing protein [Haladaptatus sp. NG-WS-4]